MNVNLIINDNAGTPYKFYRLFVHNGRIIASWGYANQSPLGQRDVGAFTKEAFDKLVAGKIKHGYVMTENKMSDWVTTGYELASELEGSVSFLRTKANSVAQVGSSRLAKDLELEALRIENVSVKLRTLLSNKVDSDFKGAQENSAAMLNAVFAGIDLAKK